MIGLARRRAAPETPPPPDPAQELVDASRAADEACLALVSALERRAEAIRVGMRAGAVSSVIGSRFLQRRAVDRAFLATGLTELCTVERPSAASRASFSEQAKQLLNHP